MSYLEILNLSETNVESLSSMSNLKNLNVLILSGCSHLKVVTDLVTLTNLKVLDLCGTTVSGLESLSSFTNLRQFHSSSLLGNTTTTTQLSHGISDLPHLELLELPRQKENLEDDTIESEKTKGELNRQKWMMSLWSTDVQVDNHKQGIFVCSAKFDEFLKDHSLWDASFKQFHFLVRPLNQLNKMEDYKYLYKMELIFRGICFQAWQFVYPAEQVRFLEICGFKSNPESVDVILSHAAVVYITDNSFITSISDFCAEHMKKMKVCWIERCNNMKSIVVPNESTKLVEGNLEFILVSNATNLKSIVQGSLQGILKNLKCLHLDCCPKIPTLFCASQQLENLKVIEIKFCDGLKTLFEDESVLVPNLRKLHLRALPNLEKVGCVAPNLLSLQVVDCPELITVLPTTTHLKILHLKCCEKLESVFDDKQSKSTTLPELQELHLWGLPVMKSIGVKVPFLKDYIIRECEKLEYDFRGTDTK